MEEDMKLGLKSMMQKEIFEQPDVVKKLTEMYVTKDNKIAIDIPNDIENIVISASGSSYNCAAVAAPLFKEMAGVQCEYEYSSEFIMQKRHFVTPKTLFIFVSQSGETSDTLKALNIIKGLGGKTMCITNVKDSTLWKECDYKLQSDAGVEKSIASTKALTAQMLCMFFIILKIQDFKNEDISVDLRSISKLPGYLQRIIDDIDHIHEVSQTISEYQNIAILGNKNYYPIAKEGALKIKETSYINVMAYPFGEFMHGHVASLNHKAIVIAIIDDENEVSAKRNIEKILADYDPLIVCISPLENVDCCNLNITIKTSKPIKSIFGVLITLQLIACETASILKRDPDQPKGLRKVVLD